MPSNLSPSSQWTHLMGKGQSCHGDPQGIRHHRSRGLKMCLCNSKHTLCTDTNRDRRNREEKGLEKEVKKLQRAVATEAEMHNGGQAWSGEEAAWLPSQKDGWKRLKRCLSQGAPLHACLPDEQVENTAESSWNDLAKQNPEPSISLSLVKRMGGY